MFLMILTCLFRDQRVPEDFKCEINTCKFKGFTKISYGKGLTNCGTIIKIYEYSEHRIQPNSNRESFHSKSKRSRRGGKTLARSK